MDGLPDARPAQVASINVDPKARSSRYPDGSISVVVSIGRGHRQGIDLNTDGTLDKTGNGWNGWESSTMTSVITNAHARGTRVALTVESLAWGSAGAAAQATLLSSPAASGRGGVPASASAVTGNLTVVDETSSWAVYLGPDPIANPTSSTIDFVKGDVVANGVTVAPSSSGTLSATYMAGAGATTDLVFDVTGYFVP